MPKLRATIRAKGKGPRVGGEAVTAEGATADAVARGRPARDGQTFARDGAATHCAAVGRIVHVRTRRDARVAEVAQIPAFANPPTGSDKRCVTHVSHAIGIASSAASIAALSHDLVAVARAVACARHPATGHGFEETSFPSFCPVCGVVDATRVVVAAVAARHVEAAASIHGQAPAPGEAVVAARSTTARFSICVQVGFVDEVQDVFGCRDLEVEELTVPGRDEGRLDFAVFIFDGAPDHLVLVVVDQAGEHVEVDDMVEVNTFRLGDLPGLFVVHGIGVGLICGADVEVVPRVVGVGVVVALEAPRGQQRPEAEREEREEDDEFVEERTQHESVLRVVACLPCSFAQNHSGH